MKRKDTGICSKSLFGIIIAVLLVSPAIHLKAQSGSTERPDIVFVILDDLRWDALSFLDHPYVETPEIDKLRAQGAWMENSFVTTSICCPSRATFLTGTYASRHGVIDNETSEYDPEVTPPLTKYLQEIGYRTAMIGKWHMGHSGHPRPYFDKWLSFDGQGVYFDPELIDTKGDRTVVPGYTTDILTDRAIDFVREQPKDEPYFLMLSHKAVHEPFRPAPRHQDAFGADTVDPKPYSWRDTFEGKPVWHRRQQVRDVRWNWRTRVIEEDVIPDSIPVEPWKRSKKYVEQLRCLASVDDGVGRLMDSLRERGTLDNTLIVFTSDNGYFHLEHRRWDKRLAYEESLRIPMIAVYPGKIEPGSTVSEMVANVDFAPTILNYVGLPVPEHMQGLDMKPLLEGRSVDWRDVFFYEYWTDLVHSIPSMRAVRGERFKLINYPELDDIDELYDLENDPHEMTNLVKNPDYADTYLMMKDRLLAESEHFGWAPDIFPNNLPRVRGPEGKLLELSAVNGQIDARAAPGLKVQADGVLSARGLLSFNGNGSGIRIPFRPDLDPSAWPYRISVDVKVSSDGIIATQASPGYGFSLFVQDGRPGISVKCKTWIASHSTIDAPQLIFDEWTRLEAEIDYNRLSFWVDGELVETMALPLPFKAKTKAPLLVGKVGKNIVEESIPSEGFSGFIRRLSIERLRAEEHVASKPEAENP